VSLIEPPKQRPQERRSDEEGGDIEVISPEQRKPGERRREPGRFDADAEPNQSPDGAGVKP